MVAPLAVFFDLDGTLLDTNYLHTWAWWESLSAFGHDVTMAQVHRLIGKDGDDLMRELAGDPNPELDRAHAARFTAMSDSIRPLPGATDLLAAVRSRGALVVIVTSAQEEELAVLLEALGADDLISEVVHGESVDSAKPAPDLFVAALERIGAAGPDTVAVGDTGWDVIAARQADIACTALESGGVAACELWSAGAAAVYAHCQDLLDHFDASPLAGSAGTGRG